MSTQELKKRSLLKAASWRVFGSIATLLVAYCITDNIMLASSISVIELFSKTLLYYLHERIWSRLSFGLKFANEQSGTE